MHYDNIIAEVSDYMDKEIKYIPNMHGKSLTTPTGWGASNGVVFCGVGITSPSPYSRLSNGEAVFGCGIGDPVKYFGLQLNIISLDLDGWNDYGLGILIHRQLGNENSFSIGVEDIEITRGRGLEPSYYMVYSQAVQSDMFVDKKYRVSDLHFSLGIGNGRYAEKSSLDMLHGKGRYGTYVFGNVAYELFDYFNLIADWSGLNLNAGCSRTFFYHNTPISITAGIGDLTRYSSNRIRFIFSVGTGFKL